MVPSSVFILFSKGKLLFSFKFGTDVENSQFLKFFHFLLKIKNLVEILEFYHVVNYALQELSRFVEFDYL